MVNRNFRAVLVLLVTLAISLSPASSVWAAPAVVSARVLLPDGKPAVGAKVTYQSFHSFIDAPRVEVRNISVVTDKEGKFSTDVPENEGQASFDSFLVVDAPGCALEFRWGGIPVKEAIQLAPDTGLEGHVVGKQNEPVADAEVIVTAVGIGNYEPVFFQTLDTVSFPSVTAHSDANGKFRLRSVRLSNSEGVALAARAVRDGNVWRGETDNSDFKIGKKAEDNKLVVQLEPSLEVRGRVLHALTNAPIENARVAYYGWEHSCTDADGRFIFKNIFMRHFPGLSVVAPGSHGNPIYVNRPSKEVLQAGMVEDLTIRAAPFTDVSGTVINETDDDVLPFAIEVSLSQTREAGSGWTQTVRSSANTRVADGKFSFRAPVGENKLLVGDHPWIYGGTVDGKNVSLQVPLDGIQGLNIPVQKRPGYLVRFRSGAETKPAERAEFTLYARTHSGQKYLTSNATFWFSQTEKWGEVMEIRAVGNDGKELLPWTKITADSKNWPLVIEIPNNTNPQS